MSEYEKILEDIGPFGPFQVRIFLLVSLFETPLAWAMLVPIFTASNPGTACLDSTDTDQRYGDICDTVNGTAVCGNIGFKSDFTSIVSEVSDQHSQKFDTRIMQIYY